MSILLLDDYKCVYLHLIPFNVFPLTLIHWLVVVGFDKQTDRQKDRQTDRQTDRQERCVVESQTDVTLLTFWITAGRCASECFSEEKRGGDKPTQFILPSHKILIIVLISHKTYVVQ